MLVESFGEVMRDISFVALLGRSCADGSDAN